jgi:outer membrane protein
MEHVMIVRSRGLLMAALLTLAASPLAAQRIGYVDSRKILQEMPGRTAVENRIRAGLEGLQGRQKVMVDSLNAMMAAFERDSAALPQADKVARFTTMQQFDARYRDTLQALEAEAQTEQQEAMQPLFDQIRIALEDVRAAEGYAMIFDIGNQANAVVAMDRNLDLSDKVLARIRATTGVNRPTPAATPATRPPTSPPAAAPERPAGPVTQPSGVRRP